MAFYEISEPVMAMHRMGTAIYGARYQLPFSKDLAAASGKRVSQQALGRWTMGLRAAPAWLPQALFDAGRIALEDLHRRMQEIITERGAMHDLLYPADDDLLDQG